MTCHLIYNLSLFITGSIILVFDVRRVAIYKIFLRNGTGIMIDQGLIIIILMYTAVIRLSNLFAELK